MIKLTKQELNAFFPSLVIQIQKHHNQQDVAEELFVKNTPTRGLCLRHNYFVNIGQGDIYLQYVMDHVIVEPRLYLIARTLHEVILYSGKEEFELARILDKAQTEKQNFELN